MSIFFQEPPSETPLSYFCGPCNNEHFIMNIEDDGSITLRCFKCLEDATDFALPLMLKGWINEWIKSQKE